MRLPHALHAWGTPEFEAVAKAEIERLDPAQLPLQQGLSSGSYVVDRPFGVMILGVAERDGYIRVKAGVFYAGIIAGCACEGDPTPTSESSEYCELRFDIDQRTGAARVSLLQG